MSTKELTKIQADLAIKPAINSLAQSSMFWKPDYLRPSSWLEQVPFLFWLVEALQPKAAVTLGLESGVSHFALCQAVQRLGLNTRCYATFNGQGGDEAVDDDSVSSYHDAHFDSFSSLMRSPTVQAASRFEDASVDLLLLNPTAEEDLESLFARWHFKLSSRSVVLVRGISRRDPSCETFRAFEALSKRFPTFVFHHGEGLGAIFVGSEQAPLLAGLVNQGESASAHQVVRDVFARLGRTCKDAVQAQEYLHKAEALEASLVEHKRELDQLNTRYESSRSELEAKQLEVAGFEQRMELATERHALERDRLAERVSLLQEFRDELKGEVAQLRQRLDEQYLQVNERNQQLIQLQVSSAGQLHDSAGAHHHQDARSQELASAEAEVQRLKSELEKQEAAVSEAATRLEEVQRAQAQEEAQHVRLLEERVQQLEGNLAESQSVLDERYGEIAVMTELLEKGGPQGEAQAQAFSIKEAQANQRIRDLERQVTDLKAQLDASDRDKQQATSAQQAIIDRLTDELSAQAAIHKGVQKQAEGLTEALRAAEKSIAEYSDREQETKHYLAQLSSRAQALEHQLKKEKQAHHTITQEQLRSEARARSLESELAAAKSEVEVRFQELALLTQLLEERDAELLSVRAELERATHSKLAIKDRSFRSIGLPVGKRTRKLRKTRKALAQIEQSGLFDADWYLRTYPDVAEDAQSASNPSLHYLKFGGYEGRNPSPGFDSQWYLDSNPDVKDSGINPLVHYVSMGRQEGRTPTPY
ncbi:hypothetical protein [Microbulbifer celer]|uniref:Chromosome partition protein Smc n=1 Tax=Microbulbifer celer TaxID=435905 RepID=A0ABW3U4J8_9GAMM|nr:hypothetical protein [Microbulbifer celer]UFN57872.1 hypothetical protein LPW13_02165 [Microbulbifer celer]